MEPKILDVQTALNILNSFIASSQPIIDGVNAQNDAIRTAIDIIEQTSITQQIALEAQYKGQVASLQAEIVIGQGEITKLRSERNALQARLDAIDMPVKPIKD